MTPELSRLEQALGRLPPGRRTAPGREALLRGDHQLDRVAAEALATRPETRPLTPAAVLVPIVVAAPEPTLLLTLRTAHLREHAGQVSFPGGRIEPADASPEAAALREAGEQVGLEDERVRLLGRLDTYVTGTGFEVTPVVGLVTPPFALSPDPFEVAEIFEVPLSHFLTPGNRQLMSREFKGRQRQFYAYPYNDYFICGATAGMLNNLAEILNGAEA